MTKGKSFLRFLGSVIYASYRYPTKVTIIDINSGKIVRNYDSIRHYLKSEDEYLDKGQYIALV